MSHKEKAKELVDKYLHLPSCYEHANYSFCIHQAKQSAIICVDEILNCEIASDLKNSTKGRWHTTYWQSVKQEIEAL